LVELAEQRVDLDTRQLQGVGEQVKIGRAVFLGHLEQELKGGLFGVIQHGLSLAYY
jgi:hypothetical protein